MAKRQRLTEKAIARISDRKPAAYGDGGRGSFGLILRVRPRQEGGQPHKYFVQRLRIEDRVTHVGLGTWPVMKLAEAREACIDNLRTVRGGGDPRQQDPFADVRPSTGPTFREAAEIVLDIHRPTWSHPRTALEWERSLRDYAYPRIGHKAVSEVTSADVMSVLVPIWSSMRPTAKKIGQRISAVLSWAAAQGYRTDDPTPAALKSLPRNGAKVEHFASTPHENVRDEIAKVRQVDAPEAAKLAAEFIALTGARSGEVRGATWTEIDSASRVWEIPGERRKTGTAWPVPLSDAALAVLEKARVLADDSGLVFPGQRGRQMSAATVQKVVKAAEGNTLHGYRSSLRSWAAAQGVAAEVGEALLGHQPRGIVATYQRDALLDLRRPVLEAWAKHVTP